MGKVIPQVYTVDLSVVRTEFDYIVAPRTGVRAIYIASMPAGASLSLAIDGKNPFRIYPGWALTLDSCDYIDDGFAIVNPVALAGQTMQVVIIPAANTQGGAGVTNAS